MQNLQLCRLKEWALCIHKKRSFSYLSSLKRRQFKAFFINFVGRGFQIQRRRAVYKVEANQKVYAANWYCEDSPILLYLKQKLASFGVCVCVPASNAQTYMHTFIQAAVNRGWQSN
jgi:hypothetical protein